MFQVNFDDQELQQLINEAVDKAIKRHAIKDSLPPMLTRKQFMDLMQIGSTKCSELFAREDFPVNHELGNPRVDTALLLEWIHKHTNWVEENAAPKSPLKII